MHAHTRTRARESSFSNMRMYSSSRGSTYITRAQLLATQANIIVSTMTKSCVPFYIPGWNTLCFEELRYRVPRPKVFLFGTSRQDAGYKML